MMRVQRFSTTSHLFPETVFAEDTPICAVCGSSVYLQLLRELISGESCDPIAPEKKQTFSCSADLMLDGRRFVWNGVLCDDQSFYVTVSAEGLDRISLIADTIECQRRLRRRNVGGQNLLSAEHKGRTSDALLSESDLHVACLADFLDHVCADRIQNDDRPIFLFDLFDRIDEAVDISPWLDRLASLGRQVFLSVGASYPTDKLRHKGVQTVRLPV